MWVNWLKVYRILLSLGLKLPEARSCQSAVCTVSPQPRNSFISVGVESETQGLRLWP